MDWRSLLLGWKIKDGHFVPTPAPGYTCALRVVQVLLAIVVIASVLLVSYAFITSKL